MKLLKPIECQTTLSFLRMQWELAKAVMSGSAEGVSKLLMEYPLERNDRFSYNMLRIAFNHQYDNVAKAILRYPVNVNREHKDCPHNTPLHLAAKFGYYELTYVLLINGADPFSWNEDFETPLHVACKSEYHKYKPFIAHLLLVAGADVNAVNKYSATPLFLAAKIGCRITVRILLQFRPDISITDCRKNTVLHVAAAQGNPHVAGILLTHGGMGLLYKRNSRRRTPLHNACKGGNAVMAKILIQYGADLNAKDEKYQTPLHLAAINGWPDVVWVLLKEGCDQTVRDIRNRTAQEYADDYGYEYTLWMFFNYDTQSVNIHKRTILKRRHSQC